MYLSEIKIKNFRGIKEGTVNFKKGTNILIGPSNIGKTSLIEAIELLLCPKKQWWRRDILSEHDFYCKNCKEDIVIEGLIGCSSKSCTGNECKRFEIETEEGSEICKLSDYVLAMDINKNTILKIDDIDNETDYELVLKVKMTASFNENDGYVDTKHIILNENNENWVNFSRNMKAWIGIEFLNIFRNIDDEFKLKYNSLLSKFAGNIDEWKYGFLKEFRDSLESHIKEFSDKYLEEILRQVNKEITSIFPELSNELNVSVEGADKNDLTRQIGLSCKLDEDFDLPFSYQGSGFKNILSLLLATRLMNTFNKNYPSQSIILLEEPEQNLEPQTQRSIIKALKKMLETDSDNKQFIISTHSPHILTNNLSLEGVIKLEKNNQDVLTGVNLDNIKTNEDKCFFDVRKFSPTDIELFESLFATVVVIWEGESETGFYTGLMKNTDDYPAELLYGICGEGSTIYMLAEWFKNANYKTTVILDGDDPNIIEDLKSRNIPFMALPEGTRIEQIIAKELIKLPDEKLSYILLSVIGLKGIINYHSAYRSKWVALYEIFNEKNAINSSIRTEEALARIGSIVKEKNINTSINKNSIVYFLDKNKKRRKYEELARLMKKENCVPAISEEILKKLSDVLKGISNFNQLQF